MDGRVFPYRALQLYGSQSPRRAHAAGGYRRALPCRNRPCDRDGARGWQSSLSLHHRYGTSAGISTRCKQRPARSGVEGRQRAPTAIQYCIPAQALEAFFAPHADIVGIRAMDLFVSRFAPDVNWTASLIASLPERPAVVQKLKEMEDGLCRLPGWIDHGTHVLIVVHPRPAADGSQAQLPAAHEGVPVVSFADFLARRSREAPTF